MSEMPMSLHSCPSKHGMLTEGSYLDQEIMREWSNLLQSHKDNISDPLGTPCIGQRVVDLACAEYNAPDLICWQQKWCPCLGMLGQVSRVV